MPKTVTLDETMCCALAHSFKNVQLLAQWGNAVGRLKLHAEILLLTTSMTFIPGDEVASVYRAFALAERERLATCGAHHGLRCPHAPAAHRDALDTILLQLPMVH